uniref:Uncharacterized protein n=1 Tax=Myoviridae sp. ctHMa1 TaxID=2827671 RepID=A0A8S5SH12_9CAUD|nr:MAG TPA: hypothetical protein [Myoviridae sp. ctHMa1]
MHLFLPYYFSVSFIHIGKFSAAVFSYVHFLIDRIQLLPIIILYFFGNLVHMFQICHQLPEEICLLGCHIAKRVYNMKQSHVSSPFLSFLFFRFNSRFHLFPEGRRYAVKGSDFSFN